MLIGGMAAFTGEALSRADVAWLHADSPTSHFVVTSLAILDSPLDVARLKAMLGNRIAQHPRLRQVVRESPLPFDAPRWVPATGFDIDAHIHRVALPAPAGTAELASFIGDLFGQPLDTARPMWELHVVEGPGRGGALVGRFHHSLGDGQAMVRLLRSLTDETPDGWKRRPSRRRKRGASQPGDGRSALARAIDAIPAPLDLLRTAADGAGTLARLTLLDPDPPTLLHRPLSMLKAVSWTPPLSLAAIKAVAHATDTTVNDVAVSVVAGGFGAYLRRAGVGTAGMRIRAMVPVNLRPPDDEGMTGNRFSLVYLEMPVGVTDPRERLMRVKTEMDRIKASLEPATGWLLVQGLGFLPKQMEQLASRFYAQKASLVLTNVIGPAEPVYSSGTRIRQMTFWEPQSGELGVGVSIYSYAGSLTIGAVADRNLVADPHVLTSDFSDAMEALSMACSSRQPDAMPALTAARSGHARASATRLKHSPAS